MARGEEMCGCWHLVAQVVDQVIRRQMTCYYTGHCRGEFLPESLGSMRFMESSLLKLGGACLQDEVGEVGMDWGMR